MEKATTKKRNANMELLRLLLMFMIIMLHALGKSNLLVDIGSNPSVNGVIAWGLEALSLCAVNVFILLSGYYLINSKFRIGRLIELIAEMIFYSLGAFLVCYLFGIDIQREIDTHFLLHTVFPVHMDLYWFLTVYVFVYIMQPMISAGVKALSQKQFRTIIVLLLIFECGFKSFMPFRFEEDMSGYNLIWFLTLFLLGAYFQLYGESVLKKSFKGLILYFVSSVMIVVERIVLFLVYDKTGHFGKIRNVTMDYNHIFVFLAGVGLFIAFMYSKPIGDRAGKVICALSPMALGIYLVHENLSLRFNWQKWTGIFETIGDPTPIFVGRIFLAVIIVFVCGLAIDFVRIQIFKLFKTAFEKVLKKHEA